MTDKEENALIHSDNDLVKVFHQLKRGRMQTAYWLSSGENTKCFLA